MGGPIVAPDSGVTSPSPVHAHRHMAFLNFAASLKRQVSSLVALITTLECRMRWADFWADRNDAFRHPKDKISTFHTIDLAQDTRQRGPLSMERYREA
jgi:hypothetical protein